MQEVWLVCALALSLGLRLTFAQSPDHGDNFTIECTGHDEFMCDEGACIPISLHCDGESNCADGTDEEFCSESETGLESGCNETSQFRCADSGYCIPLDWRCNNDPDCQDKSDEENCTEIHDAHHYTGKCDGFLCDDGQCIPDLWECDLTPDCKDKSDEDSTRCKGRHPFDHNPPANFTILCNKDNGLFPCHDQTFCLPPDRVCNNKKECKDGSDEAPGCAKTCDNNNCSHGCVQTPDGPHCKCPLGYAPTSNETCREVNECLELYSSCTQHCEDKYGYFKCSCEDGYELYKDGYRCVAKGGEAILFYSLRNQVKAYFLKSKKSITITSHTEQAVGVTYDGHHVYWTEVNEGHEAIMRAQLEDPKGTKEVVVQTGLDTPEDVNIDWLTGNIYFSDSRMSHIGVCSPEGRHCAVLVSENMHRPRAIALHPQRGQMYWSDWGDVAMIIRANMDGSDPVVFLKDNLIWPNGLFLDFPNDRLYWVDGHAGGIESIRLDGTSRHEVLQNEIHHPYWVSVFESKLFWSDWGSDTLQVCEKFHGTERRIITHGKIYGIHVWHKAMMPQQPHACQHELCSDLCLLRGNASYTCACPEDKILGVDKHTCHDAVRPQYLLVTGGVLMVRVRYRQLGRLELSPVMLQLGSVDAQAYNSIDDVVYLYDGLQNNIKYVNMRDYKQGVGGFLINHNLDKVEDMAYDFVSNVLYWVDSGRKTIEVYSVRTGHRTILYKFGGEEVPISICVIPQYGILMVALRDGYDEVHIDSMGLDGTRRKHLFENGFIGPTIKIRYYDDMDKVYISDSGTSIIETVHPEGSGRETFRNLYTSVSSLAVAGSEVFWTNRKSSNLYWSNVHDAGNGPNRRLNLDVFTNHTQLHLTPIVNKPSSYLPIMTHPCAKSTSKCTHICVQSDHHGRTTGQHPSFMHEYACLCPSGMFTDVDDKSCKERVKCSHTELYCHRSNECVGKASKCDGRLDCRLGEDEEGCIDPSTHKCPNGQFQCTSGECIPENHRCDLHIDCLDSSDEDRCEGHGMAIVCSKDQFECTNGTCIDPRLVCDGAADCPDKSDETASLCDTLQCSEDQFQCEAGNCIPGRWVCDQEVDCDDGSDENDKCPSQAVKQACAPFMFRCSNDHCVNTEARCNGQDDCGDESDEDDCQHPVDEPTQKADDDLSCVDKEYLCPSNRTICLHYSARCNSTKECPYGEDEIGCDEEIHCTSAEFHCGDGRCIALNLVCDGIGDCRDHSDETHDACIGKNITRQAPVSTKCDWGYQCLSGQCLDYGEVCDGVPNCFDQSDELGSCETACEHHRCEHTCAPTPQGAVCRCKPGYALAADSSSCQDINECANPESPCSHDCQNIVDGSFFCRCRYGYTLRSDKRSCKAKGEPLRILTLANDTVRSVTRHGDDKRVIFKDKRFRNITDIDINVAANSLYFTIESQGLIYQMDLKGKYQAPVSNVGSPTKLAVDWITDNVYFADNTEQDKSVRVCNMRTETCARLQKLPNDSEVTALSVDPASRIMFYCVTRPGPIARSSLYRADLDGRHIHQLANEDLSMCSGLALDSYKKQLYVAENHADSIVMISYEGTGRRKVVFNDHRVLRPEGLALFEDHIYFLTSHSHTMTRCLLFGSKTCEEFNIHTYSPLAFALLQGSAQRRDAANTCAEFNCENVCTPAPLGAKCVCLDGNVLMKGGSCADVPEEMLPVFNAAHSARMGRGARVAYGMLGFVLFVLVLVGGALVYRYWQNRHRHDGIAPAVHFHNPNRDHELGPRPRDPVVNITGPNTGSSGYYEFVNPIRGAWRSMQSRMSSDKTDSTKHLSLPREDSDSEVESDRDIDMRDKALLL